MPKWGKSNIYILLTFSVKVFFTISLMLNNEELYLAFLFINL